MNKCYEAQVRKEYLHTHNDIHLVLCWTGFIYVYLTGEMRFPKCFNLPWRCGKIAPEIFFQEHLNTILGTIAIIMHACVYAFITKYIKLWGYNVKKMLNFQENERNWKKKAAWTSASMLLVSIMQNLVCLNVCILIWVIFIVLTEVPRELNHGSIIHRKFPYTGLNKMNWTYSLDNF